jgi:hypothetical protein
MARPYGFFKLQGAENVLGRGRRVYSNAAATDDSRRRYPPRLQHRMQRPSDSAVRPCSANQSPFTFFTPRLGEPVKCRRRLTLDGTEVLRPPIVVRADFLVTGARTD